MTAKKVNPIPKGYRTVTTALVVKNAKEAIEFYKKALGAKERGRHYLPDGKTILHSELQIGNTVIMLSDEFPGMKCLSPQSIGGTSFSLYVYVKDVDKTFKQAAAAGATVTMPVMDAFWGDRAGQFVDPYGHMWMLASRKENLSKKEMEKAGREWAASMANQH